MNKKELPFYYQITFVRKISVNYALIQLCFDLNQAGNLYNE